MKKILLFEDYKAEKELKSFKEKAKRFFDALKKEGKETIEAFKLIAQSYNGEIELTDVQRKEIGEQLKDTLKTAGLTTVAFMPGGAIVALLLHALKLYPYILPSNFKYMLEESDEIIEEGVNDPGILKAFFMAGGPGSGKSYVATELFDFPKGATSSVSYATGLKLVNNDNFFEKMLKDSGYDISKLADYAKNPEVWAEVMTVRNKAKATTKRMQDNYIGGRLGQVIDGTGKDFDKIKGIRNLYTDFGYDTYMVFVNTTLDVALERNRQRERKLDDSMVKKMWQEVQNNLGKFQKLFGADKMLIVDNSEYGGDVIEQVEKQIAKHLRTPIQNPLGKIWIREQTPEMKMKNRPM
jgi:predicted kinase